MYSNAEQQIKNALDDLDGAIKYITDAANQHPNRLDICQAKGGNISPPPTDPRSSSGAFTRGPAFGQPSFGQPSAPAPGSAFGKPSFGQAAAPAAAFGQAANLGQQSMTSGQPSNSAAATAFGQSSTPSLFGQAQQTAKPFGLQQPQQQPAFGQSGSPFGQQSSTGPQTSSAFGQQPTLATSNPFATASKPTFGHDQSTTASASAFGPSAVPQPSGIFAQSSASQTTANTFGSKDSGPTSSAFGQSVPTPAPAFGKPTAPATTGMFGKPSAPSKSTGFAPQSIPVVGGGPSNTAPSLIPPRSGPPTSATFGPGKVGDRKLLTWQGHKVEYIDEEPCVKTAGDGGWQRIWFPEGAPTFTGKTQEYPDGYVLDERARENFNHFLQHGVGSDGLIPNMPPPRDMLSWNF